VMDVMYQRALQMLGCELHCPITLRRTLSAEAYPSKEVTTTSSLTAAVTDGRWSVDT
jgi:hypothetical protein